MRRGRINTRQAAVVKWNPPNFEEAGSVKRRHVDFAASLALPAWFRSAYGARSTTALLHFSAVGIIMTCALGKQASRQCCLACSLPPGICSPERHAECLVRQARARCG